MSIDVISVELFVVELPMVKPFIVSFGTTSSRRLVLVRLTDREGVVGWGEAATLDQPVYNSEYVTSVFSVIEQIMGPALLRQGNFASPQALDDALSFVRGHCFAKSALSMAAYDIAAQKAGKSLAAYIGGTKTHIALSRTISIVKEPREALDIAAEMVAAGFHDIKLKIKPNADIIFAKALRAKYPDARLMVDANAGYRFSDETINLFRELDELDFFCIEQPLDWNDLYDHAKLQEILKTPIALDESIEGLHDFEQALALKSCRLLNMKIQRVGGFTEAKRIYDLGLKNNIGLWVGGMIEGPIGLAAVMSLSTLEGMTLPADYIDPHYLIKNYQDYFTAAPYIIADGKVKPNFSAHGLGLPIDFDRLCLNPERHVLVQS